MRNPGRQFRDLHSKFVNARVPVFGVSRDTLASHEKFKKKMEFPFELREGTTVLYNREHLVAVALEPGVSEAELDPGYDIATQRHVGMLLSTGMRVRGKVAVYAAPGRDRLSDYTRTPELFRHVETPDGTVVVNLAHIVELREIGTA